MSILALLCYCVAIECNGVGNLSLPGDNHKPSAGKLTIMFNQYLLVASRRCSLLPLRSEWMYIRWQPLYGENELWFCVLNYNCGIARDL